MRLKTTLAIALATCLCIQLQAQITVGSDIEPNDGALLDLKQKTPDAQNVNATKGLGLPRVSLNSLTSLDDIANASSAVETYKGLTVYNVNSCFNQGTGIYVWSGDEWKATGLQTVRDHEGNEYTTAAFGNAGVWMTQNLRTKSYKNGDETLTPSQTLIQDGETSRFFCYPNVDGGNGLDSNLFDANPPIGLLYNWPAATNGENTATANQGQGGGNDDSYVQGICPDGWHLPNDKEWNELEKVIALNPEKYSSKAAGSITWNDSWAQYWTTETSQSRPTNGNSGHGIAMRSPCALNTPNAIVGLSRVPQGFNVLSVGNYTNQGLKNYGQFAYFHTSSVGANPNQVWGRIFYSAAFGEGVYRTNSASKSSYYSVRCKKDTF
ncbi:MAG: FISUMP domain-containing protein [Dysgonomonas sp.]|nr:FISUMP domain-containing protein [Dysgonomonas sp.]